MATADETPEVKVIVKKETAPKVGLAADAKAAKAQHEKDDQAIADSHKELRDAGKIVEQTPLIGYEAARQNMYVEASERTTPEPVNVDEVAPPKS